MTADDEATGTIFDDETPSVTIADARAAEGEALTFTVTLDKAVSGGLTVTPSFTDVTATEGTDYTENTAALKFAGTADETRTFTVQTAGDAMVEADETFTVSLTVSGNSSAVTATDTATGTITNDDGSATVTVDDASASEGETITFTVTLDNAVAGGLTVTPAFTDGTATKGTDYTENTAGITFAGTANETQTFTVATTEDTDEEDEETFTVTLTSRERRDGHGYGTGTTSMTPAAAMTESNGGSNDGDGESSDESSDGESNDGEQRWRNDGGTTTAGATTTAR